MSYRSGDTTAKRVLSHAPCLMLKQALGVVCSL